MNRREYITLPSGTAAARAGPGRTEPCGHRANLDLGSARPALPRARSVTAITLDGQNLEAGLQRLDCLAAGLARTATRRSDGSESV